MTLPELDEFRRRLTLLRDDPVLVDKQDGDALRLADLSLPELSSLLNDETAYYFLIAAAQLNRSSLKKAMAEPEAQLVAPKLRRAYAVSACLPVTASYSAVAASAMSLRQGDLQRKARGQVEQTFRDRLAEEKVPLLMSPPVRQVPGVVIARRKPDGVWPDPALGGRPMIYLEIKNIRRVADDIQKRLYELVEASLEMKLLYGAATWRGLDIRDGARVRDPATAQALRAQIVGSPPIMVGLLICSRQAAERYRPGAEAFIDRIFFQDEIEECIDFLKRTIATLAQSLP